MIYRFTVNSRQRFIKVHSSYSSSPNTNDEEKSGLQCPLDCRDVWCLLYSGCLDTWYVGFLCLKVPPERVWRRLNKVPAGLGPPGSLLLSTSIWDQMHQFWYHTLFPSLPNPAWPPSPGGPAWWGTSEVPLSPIQIYWGQFREQCLYWIFLIRLRNVNDYNFYSYQDKRQEASRYLSYGAEIQKISEFDLSLTGRISPDLILPWSLTSHSRQWRLVRSVVCSVGYLIWVWETDIVTCLTAQCSQWSSMKDVSGEVCSVCCQNVRDSSVCSLLTGRLVLQAGLGQVTAVLLDTRPASAAGWSGPGHCSITGHPAR